MNEHEIDELSSLEDQILAIVPPTEREAMFIPLFAECVDLTPGTALDLQDAMLRPIPDDIDERQDLADDLVRLFRRACEDFLQARREHGLSEATYPGDITRHWQITDATHYGAQAFVDETGRDCVRIEGGTLNFLLWAALKYVAANETDARPIVRRRPRGRSTGSLLHAFDIPADPTIRSLAIGMAMTAFQFLFLHEVGHLAQGHCRLLAGGLSDYQMDGEGGPANPKRQSMELMADVFALRDLLALFRARREAVEALPLTPQTCFLSVQSRIYTEVDLTLTCITSALACLFYLTSRGGGNHPNREIRFIALMLAMKVYLRADMGDSDSDWLKRVCAVVVHVGDAMRESHDLSSEFTFLTAPIRQESNHGAVMEEINNLIATFERIRPELIPYARGEHAFISVAL